jgi:hypothetical protein
LLFSDKKIFAVELQQVDIGSEFDEQSEETLAERIIARKEELGEKLLILAHHYQQESVYRFADMTGDSLKLAKHAAASDNKPYIVFCGVHFMAEAADILTGDNQAVILPDLRAGCPMADMASLDEVTWAWKELSEAANTSKIIPVTYVNSSAAIKAFVGERHGSVCTSSNAERVLTWALEQGDKVFFFPDEHLGRNSAIALGIDPATDDLTNLRYHKVCILADADSDGLHIATLLCALFVRHFSAMVNAGHVYVAMPPLYRIDVGKEVFYALDEGEKQGVLDRIAAEKKSGKINVQRFKGLGEMNPLQLRDTTMNPDTRRLVQLTMDAGDDTHKTLDMLLSKKRAGDRKNWLEERGNLAEV